VQYLWLLFAAVVFVTVMLGFSNSHEKEGYSVTE
jgi:hypothetical protein